MSARRSAIYLFFYISIITLLLLSALNIENYLAPKEVLGIETESGDREIEYWNEFLTKNPDYIPGWIEMGRWDKVRQIDPNYLPQF